MIRLRNERVVLSSLVAMMVAWPDLAGAAKLTPIEELGRNVFNDKISKPEDQQSCASCHDLRKGGTLPISEINKTTVVAPGAKPRRLGSIKTPTNTYATFSAPFRNSPSGVPGVPDWEGGNFWDGRAEGYGVQDFRPGGGPADDDPFGDAAVSETITLNDLPSTKRAAYEKYLGPTADQALNPFPNKVEQNIRIKRVCKTVRDATYAYLYTLAYDEPISCRQADYLTSYKRIAVALAAYQASAEVNPFNSKRDRALNSDPDKLFPLTGLSAKENLGHDLFYSFPVAIGGPGGGGCVACHNGVPRGDAVTGDGTEPRQLYTDERFHNIGTPFNRQIPAVVKGEKKGLSGHITQVFADPTQPKDGFFRTPTVRNVAKGASKSFTKAYTHNGYFKSLKSLVHFYNTRDTKDDCEARWGIVDATEEEALANDCWPRPEFPATAAFGVVGNLGLTPEQEDAIVAYLEALSDK